jgi:hypothetical protein
MKFVCIRGSSINFLLLLLFSLCWLVPWRTEAQSNLRHYSVEAFAQVQNNSIKVEWRPDSNAQDYHIARREPGQQGWTELGQLSGASTSFTDNQVQSGKIYEYRIIRITGSYKAFGFVYAGHEIPLRESRGKVILLVENSYAGDLESELNQFEQDLIGDGWTVVRRQVSRHDSVPSVKDVIKTAYNLDPANTRSLILFGRIPVPYSGNMLRGHLLRRYERPMDRYRCQQQGG